MDVGGWYGEYDNVRGKVRMAELDGCEGEGGDCRVGWM